MQALRLRTAGLDPELEEVPTPVPVGREVLVRVRAAGLCHSDLHVVESPVGGMATALPFTLGHEIAGEVAALADDVAGTMPIGTAVAVYGPWGCGDCSRCRVGRDNLCDRRASLTFFGAGLGRDGGMAEYVLVPRPELLVPLDGVDPLDAAPLTDAGLTSYAALRPLLPDLTGADASVLVLGVGGLGHMAVQLLSALTTATVVAVDTKPAALELAGDLGAIPVASGPDAGDRIREQLPAGAAGVDAVLDFVGAPETVALGSSLLRPGATYVLVGTAGGAIDVRKNAGLPAGVKFSVPYWGGREELAELLALAAQGRIHVHRQVYPLSDAARALADLRAGRISGRAVLVPSPS
ncbi:alcohol dehydrogenase catalytic domain-containing protein [Nakamurella sp. YIM 132087]|uniref:alcohol dehydrogenase n=1 Tax=Nakamurella alba TaxID=2665158 RepID=A0A7K1FV81_9ACTN|nr:alcohol dehydrogenase catalytic domain-containing protein [Nakamurella alba]MTD17269.1 alcohol dehydrogenase catalytic domain-containing protein [Nakamurella alba]